MVGWIRKLSAIGAAAALSAIGVAAAKPVSASSGPSVHGAKKHTSTRSSSQLPYFKHVFVIMLENHSYADTWYEHDMPYLQSLARTYGLPTEMYGITNPTVPNRVGLLSGRGRTIGDNVNEGQLNYTNLVDQLEQHHLTWGAYYQHTETSTAQHPVYNFSESTFNLFKDIYNNPSREAHLQTFPDLAQALQDNTVPNFVWVGPNFITNSHGSGSPGPYQYTYQGAGPGGSAPNDTRLEQGADTFLQRWVPRIMNSKAWHSGPSAIFITEDETSYDASMPQIGEWASDLGTAGSPVVPSGTVLGGYAAFPFPGGVNGGGRIPAVVITNTARHVVSSQPFNQFSILKTIESAWHLGYLGQAANPKVHTMSVFFHGGTKAQGPSATPWSTGPGAKATTAHAWANSPYEPALPPKDVSSTDATLRPIADPHLSQGANGQAASGLELFVTSQPTSITGNLTLTLIGSQGVTFAKRSSPVGSTKVGNADEDATQFGPSVVSARTVTLPIANTGTVAEELDVSGLMLDVGPNAQPGPVQATLASGSTTLGTVTLGTVGRPAVRSTPNLLAPIIQPDTVQVRFTAPKVPGARYEVEIEGQNPVTAVGPDLSEKYVAYTRSDNVVISNGAAELTALAGKQYWVRVRLVSGRNHRAMGNWSTPLPFTALRGALPPGVS
ncbi:alkaline phosphatase family protein [Sulfobacillus harzensis]|uniref:Phosphoesterase n=1 Tax=Sulfobacillus harzensis TaxID=2729629 RepID=A0A7Y0Q591_9FIRM|nr:alkaline phosphatase family protein [Sulfobacillus harzensis]NMP24841.1 hypothetical protein [Sulfobacillus harzensis]